MVNDDYLDHFEHHLSDKMLQRIKEVKSAQTKDVADEGSQTAPQPAPRFPPDIRKQQRGPPVSPQESATKMPEERRPRTSRKEEEWVDVLVRKNPRKNKPKTEAKKPERSRRIRPEAMIIKPAMGVSYAAILKNLKSRVSPKKLGATIGRIRETHLNDLLPK